MKELLNIQDTPENKISYYFLILFLVALPFDRFYSEVILITLIPHTLIHINREKIRAIISWQNLLLCSVFVLNLIGMAWSKDRGEALKDAEHQLSILLFPLLLSATGLDLRKYKKRLLTIFSFTCVAIILYLYADAFHIIWNNKLSPKSLFSWSFVNHNFSAPIGMHATYLSLYAALAVSVFFSIILAETNYKTRLLYVAAIVILLAGLLQLATKSVLIALLVFTVQGFLFFIPAGTRRIRLVVITVIVLLITLFGITQVDYLRKRYLTELKDDLTQASAGNEILEPRIIRWRSAVPLVQHSPLIGYGSGSEKRLLKEQYFKNKLYDSYLHELNAHNQYLSFLIKTGLLGLLVFFFTLSYGFLIAWRNKDLVFVCFIILLSIVSTSENILDVNKGVFFYAFFLTFLVKSSKSFDQLFRK